MKQPKLFVFDKDSPEKSFHLQPHLVTSFFWAKQISRYALLVLDNQGLPKSGDLIEQFLEKYVADGARTVSQALSDFVNEYLAAQDSWNQDEEPRVIKIVDWT